MSRLAQRFSPRYFLVPLLDKVETAVVSVARRVQSSKPVTNHSSQLSLCLAAAIGLLHCSGEIAADRLVDSGANIGATDAGAADAGSGAFDGGPPWDGSTGWTDLGPTTAMSQNNWAVCPNPSPGGDGCRGVIDAWGDAIGDTKRDRMILWGGGHVDYWGNELYALTLQGVPALVRLNDPSSTVAMATDSEAMPDGRPTSRHTYGGLAYDSFRDQLFSWGGSRAKDGFFSYATWTLDLGALDSGTTSWTHVATNCVDPFAQGFCSSNAPTCSAGCFGAAVAFDPNTHFLFLHDTSALFSYDPSTSTYALINGTTAAFMHYNTKATIDPKRRRFVQMGSGSQIHVFDISNPTATYTNVKSPPAPMVDLSGAAGCPASFGGNAPGLQYDPGLDRIVIYLGSGNSVYLLDLDAGVCTTKTFAGGPTHSTESSGGVSGRFQYLPGIGAYAVVTSDSSDGFALRLQ
jgi:hypothetical protein